jgi:glycosyltransferase involved in cell wall biosynthesis
MSRDDNKKPSILFIVNSDYRSLVEKGVVDMILERDEGGFFGKVFTVHPYASRTQALSLNETHQLIEYGSDYPFSFLNFKFGRLANHFLKVVWIIRDLVNLARVERIDLIRAIDPYWCGFYAWAVSRPTHLPFCISIHADYDKCYFLNGRKKGAPPIYKALEKFVLPRAQLVMPIREYLAQRIANKGVDRGRIRVIPHGVNTDMFLPGEGLDIHQTFGIDPRKKILSFVGRLAKENYVYDILHLAKRLVNERDDFVILVTGDGLERQGLEAVVREWNLSRVVIFTGFQPRPKAISIRRHSFLALCLMGGFSLIEACIAGCPVIAYNVEWHHELVRNGDTGFLINENDLDALTTATTYLLDRPEEAKEMGRRARELATSRHAISYTSEIKKNCYRELLQRGT